MVWCLRRQHRSTLQCASGALDPLVQHANGDRHHADLLSGMWWPAPHRLPPQRPQVAYFQIQEVPKKITRMDPPPLFLHRRWFPSALRPDGVLWWWSLPRLVSCGAASTPGAGSCDDAVDFGSPHHHLCASRAASAIDPPPPARFPWLGKSWEVAPRQAASTTMGHVWTSRPMRLPKRHPWWRCGGCGCVLRSGAAVGLWIVLCGVFCVVCCVLRVVCCVSRVACCMLCVVCCVFCV